MWKRIGVIEGVEYNPRVREAGQQEEQAETRGEKLIVDGCSHKSNHNSQYERGVSGEVDKPQEAIALGRRKGGPKPEVGQRGSLKSGKNEQLH